VHDVKVLSVLAGISVDDNDIGFVVMVYSYEERKYVPAYVCRRDSCLSEFFYPFMDIYPGESQQKTLGFALLFSIFITFGVAITCPMSIGHGAST